MSKTLQHTGKLLRVREGMIREKSLARPRNLGEHGGYLGNENRMAVSQATKCQVGREEAGKKIYRSQGMP